MGFVGIAGIAGIAKRREGGRSSVWGYWSAMQEPICTSWIAMSLWSIHDSSGSMERGRAVSPAQMTSLVANLPCMLAISDWRTGQCAKNGLLGARTSRTSVLGAVEGTRLSAAEAEDADAEQGGHGGD